LKAKQEREEWLKRDPIRSLSDSLIAGSIVTPQELLAIDTRIDAEVKDAAEFGLSSPFPPKEEAFRDVFAESVESGQPVSVEPGTRQLTLREAINEAIKEEMTRDQNVITYGQGYMGQRGGPYQVGKGLQDLFGKERVRDSPI